MIRGFRHIGMTFSLENPAVLLFLHFRERKDIRSPLLVGKMPKRGKFVGITEIMPNRIGERARVPVHVLALAGIQDYVRLLSLTYRKRRGH